MKHIEYTFSTVEELVEFVIRAEKCDFSIEVICEQTVIDGKSLMGVMSIGIGKLVKIVCHSADALPEKLVGHAA